MFGAVAKSKWGQGLWLRWVMANAVGETVGLGATAVVGAGLIASIGEETGVLGALTVAAVAILAGTLLEGTVVGTAQWLVLRRPLPEMRWGVWVLATAAGAFVAWALGMIPSTVLSLGAEGGEQAAPEEPGAAVVYGLAFLMGLLLGPVLGFAQWLFLRRYMERAVLWMPANALAWAFGMVVVFVGATSVPADGVGPGIILLLIATLACAGAVVGAIHGFALVWLLRSRRPGR